MLSSRSLQTSDFGILGSFPRSAEELFYIAPFADYPWTAEKFAEAVHASLSNTVFIDNNTIIGFANFYDYEFGQQAFIGNVIVNPATRRRGYGRQILEFMIIQGFSEHRFREIHLSCFSGNTAGLLLYRKLGFKPYGIEQRTDYKNEAVALVNMKLTETEYQKSDSGLDLKQITAELADI